MFYTVYSVKCMANCNYTSRSGGVVVVVIIYVCLQIGTIAVIGEEAVVEQQLHVGLQIACSGMVINRRPLNLNGSATVPA